MNVLISVSTKMAEQLLAEGNIDWGAEVDTERPLDEEKPHPGTWEERDKVTGRLGGDLISEEEVKVMGDPQVTDTVESTLDLAVSPEQVNNIYWFIIEPLSNFNLLQEEELARKAAEAAESRSLQ
jgi:hypothetical protein